MDVNMLTTGAAPQAPRYVQDLRPAADAAALANDNRPPAATAGMAGALPLPTLPAPVSQIGAVSRSMLSADAPAATDAPQAVSRVLKPYGVAMLPAEVPRDDAQRPAAGGAAAPADRAGD